jgi:hypothetical protein
MRVDVSIGKTGEVHRIESLEVVERLLPFLFTPAHTHNLSNNSTEYPCFGSGLDPDSIRSMDPDPDRKGQKLPIKKGEVKGNSCFEVLDVLF